MVTRVLHAQTGDPAVNASLLDLMDELLQSIEQRDAGDPDAPAWEASARIQRLEEELARRLAAAEVDRPSITVEGSRALDPGGALPVVA
jgi:hypothetical protein